MNAASPAQLSIATGRAIYRRPPLYRPLSCFKNIDWRRVFGAAGRGQALGVVVSACSSTRTIEHCIHTIYASHYDAGWRASLWIVVTVDSGQDDTAARARRVLGALREVLTVRARSLRAFYRIGIGAIAMHFGEKKRAAVVLTTTEIIECPAPVLESLHRCGS